MFSSYKIFVLCALMIGCMFLAHPKMIFTLFLFNNLLNLSVGKYFLKSKKNSMPMFIETWLLNGGLYQFILRLCFHLCTSFGDRV